MIKTTLVPGVAWPKYVPPGTVKKQYTRRKNESITSFVQEFVRTHPQCTLYDVVEALSDDVPKHTVAIALERLWANNRISAELKSVKGRRMRHYVIGPNA